MLLGTCGAASATVRAWGQRIESLETYLDPGDCPMPCWNRLQPGNQSTDAFWFVIQQVQSAGGWMYSGQPSSRDGENIYEFRLLVQPSNQIRLGDVLMIYGAPEYVQVLNSASLGRTPDGRRRIIEVYLYWADGAVEIVATQPNNQYERRIETDMWVREVHMRDPEGEPLYSEGVQPWHGFANVGDYFNGD